MGLKKGQTNNPDGRPKLVGDYGGRITLRMDAGVLTEIRRLAADWGCSDAEAIRRILDKFVGPNLKR